MHSNQTDKRGANTDGWAPTPEAHITWWSVYGIVKIVSGALNRFWFRPKIYHHDRLPRRSGAVLAANHQSFIDPLLLGTVTRRPLCFFARESLFASWPLSSLLPRLSVIPVGRGGAAARTALRKGVSVVKHDRLLVFFPEGTRTEDGKIRPLEKGVHFLAKRSGHPVVPVLIVGAFEAWPRQQRFPRFGAIRVYVGHPIMLDKTESSASFLARLSDAYRTLAHEAGAPDLLEAGHGPREPVSLTEPTTHQPWSQAPSYRDGAVQDRA